MSAFFGRFREVPVRDGPLIDGGAKHLGLIISVARFASSEDLALPLNPRGAPTALAAIAACLEHLCGD